jgi:hypothetical protein
MAIREAVGLSVVYFDKRRKAAITGKTGMLGSEM